MPLLVFFYCWQSYTYLFVVRYYTRLVGLLIFPLLLTLDVPKGAQVFSSKTSYIAAAQAAESKAAQLLQSAQELGYSGQLLAAEDQLEKALKIYRGDGNKSQQALSLVFLSEVRAALDRKDEAVGDAQAALALYRELGDRAGEAAALDALAGAQYGIEPYETTLATVEEALAISQEVGSPTLQAVILSNLGAYHTFNQEHEVALDYLKQAQALFAVETVPADEQLRHEFYRPLSLTILGSAQIGVGSLEDGLSSLDEAIELSRSSGNATGEAIALYTKAQWLVEQGEIDSALPNYESAAEVLATIDRAPLLVDVLFYTYVAYSKKGEQYVDSVQFDEASVAYEQATEAAQASLEAAQASGNIEKIVRARQSIVLSNVGSSQNLHAKARVYLEEQDYESALVALNSALEFAKQSEKAAIETLALTSEVGIESLINSAYQSVDRSLTDMGLTYGQRANVYYLSGQPEAAINDYENALKTYRIGLSYAVDSNNAKSVARFQRLSYSAHTSLGQTQYAFEQAEDSVESFQSALEIAEEFSARNDELSAMSNLVLSYIRIADTASETQDYDLAVDYYERAMTSSQNMLALAEKNVQVAGEDITEDVPFFNFVDSVEVREATIAQAVKQNLLSLQSAALFYMDRDENAEALEFASQRLSLAESLNDDDKIYGALDLVLLLQKELSQYNEALKTVERLEAIARKAENPTNLLDLLSHRAGIYDGLGLYPQAIEAYEQALALAKQQNKPIKELSMFSNIGVILGYQGQSDVLRERSEYSLKIVRDIRGKIEAADTLSELVVACDPILSAYPQYGEDPQAATFASLEGSAADKAALDRRLKNTKRNCLSTTWDVEYKDLNDIAFSYSEQGRYDIAVSFFEQALEIAEVWGSPVAKSQLLRHIGAVYFDKGDYNAAFDLTQQSYAIGKDIDAPEDLAYTLSSIGTIYSARGEYLKALAAFEQALDIVQNAKAKSFEASILREQVLVYVEQGRYDEAQARLQNALNISEEIGTLPTKAVVLVELARIARDKGNYSESMEHLETSLEIYQKIGARPNERLVLTDMGRVYQARGEFAKAFEAHQKAIAIAQELNDRDDEAIALSAIGSTYDQLGQYDRAQDAYRTALAIFQDIGNVGYEAVTLNQLGENAEEQTRYDEALDFYQQSLAIHQRVGNVGKEAKVLTSIGSLQARQGESAKAKKALQASLTIQRDTGVRIDEGNTLAGLASVAQSEDDFDEAMTLLQQALVLHKELGDSSGEAAVLAQMGRLLAENEQQGLAIVFYKQSVNTIEDIRRSLNGLPIELQQSFSERVSVTYRELADLLLQNDRVLEAQAVLDLLRAQELEEYFRDTRSATGESSDLEYWAVEQSLVDLYLGVIEGRRELERLNDRPFDSLSPSEEARKEQLINRYNEVNASFDDFLRRPDVVELTTQLLNSTLGDNIKLDNLASSTGSIDVLPNAVLIYPLMFENRLEIVVAAPNVAPIRQSVDIKAVDLKADILAYRQILSQPNTDAKPTAEKLYNALIKPVEGYLEELGAETIVYSPDGALRYIPLAALYDGDRWLAERFAVTHITDPALDRFEEQPSEDPRILAAACAQCDFSFSGTANGESYDFPALPYTSTEVNNIAKQISKTDVLIDDAFTKKEIIKRLGSYEIVHLATHGEFVSSSPDDSFLVFSGETEKDRRATLREIGNWGLRNTNLIVLSACETGLGRTALGNGIEVLGLGYQVQKAGAHAAIASLWRVDDGGTQVLMNAFYEALGEGHSKVEALRLAQVALIKGDLSIAAGEESRGDLLTVNESAGEPFALEGEADHPFYWAPFILIGNGL